jgi:hypothetical protein
MDFDSLVLKGTGLQHPAKHLLVSRVGDFPKRYADRSPRH